MYGRIRFCVAILLVASMAAGVGSAGAGAQERCPDAGNPFTAEGWTALRSGELGESRGLFLRALALCPHHLGARIGVAYVALRGGEDEEARAGLETLRVVAPENIDVLVGLGILAWRRGDLSEVGRVFSEVEALDPGNSTAADYLGRLPGGGAPPAVDPLGAEEAWNRGDMETAARLYGRILAADSTDGVALHRLALVSAWDQRYGEALLMFDRLLRLEPFNLDARVARARVLAWKGEMGSAMEALEKILAEQPGDLQALEAKAQFQSWAGEHTEALASYSELVGISQDPTGILLAQARILGAASRVEESRSAYENILARNPEKLEARLGLARVLALSGEADESVSQYRAIVRDHPDNLEGRRGLAQSLTWGGYLREGEENWRRTLSTSSQDLASRVGLAQNLRWQGRPAAALKVLEGADPGQEESPDLLEQLQWVRAAIGPRADVSLIHEGDSDDNAMTTARLLSRLSPLAGLGVRAEVYVRHLEVGLDGLDLSRNSWGVNLLGSYQVESGWTFSGGAGGTRTDASGTTEYSSMRAGITSPGGYRIGGSVNLSRSPLDATAQLVEQGVQVELLDISGRWAPAPGWQLSGSGGLGSYEAEGENRRVHLNVQASRSMRGGWTLGVSHRYFGFEEDLDEFYFDPDYFGLTELVARGLWEAGRWGIVLELSPGAQKVRSDGEYGAALRSSARMAYRVSPGREVSLSGGYSSAGLQSFNTGAGDYRYRALILGGSWVF